MTRAASEDFGLLPRVINGGIAGAIGVTCIFPIDFIKTRMQNQKHRIGQEPLYRNMFDCALKSIQRSSGGSFRQLYSGSLQHFDIARVLCVVLVGLAVNLLLITPEKAIKLVANDYFCHLLQNKSNEALFVYQQVLAGAGAGTCQIIVTTPMELLKIQMQMVRKDGMNSPIGARHVALQILRERGILGLYRGIGVTYMRDVLFSMIFFPLFTHLNNRAKATQRDRRVPFYHSLLSGMVAGGIGAFCASPIDVIKTRLQTLEYRKRYSGVIHCARKV